jgi:hypothetical protein
MLVTATEVEPKISGDFWSFSSQKSGKKFLKPLIFCNLVRLWCASFSQKYEEISVSIQKTCKFFLAGFIFTLGEHPFAVLSFVFQQ